jgi:predicted molibdopterin-dependent oxidoreductase YjgC
MEKWHLPQWGTNLIDAIRMNGVEIPTLCWSVGLEPALGTCRVCTVRKNGREVAGCTVQIGKGDVIECGASDLRNLRQGVTELLFSEGNHYCPGCEKSGDCELQSVAYDQGITHSRFPYKFSHYDLDYSGKDLMIERNRCIHCKRCTDLFVDDEGRKVFRFMGKGRKTVVEMDLKLEAEMSKHKKKGSCRDLSDWGRFYLRGKVLIDPLVPARAIVGVLSERETGTEKNQSCDCFVGRMFRLSYVVSRHGSRPCRGVATHRDIALAIH